MTFLPVHSLAGAVGLVSGAVALCSRKGGLLHRRCGMIFVYSMLAMSAIGAGLAAIRHRSLHGKMLEPQKFSVVAGALTFYLVFTALSTVRRRQGQGFDWLGAVATSVALAVAIFSIKVDLGARNETLA